MAERKGNRVDSGYVCSHCGGAIYRDDPIVVPLRFDSPSGWDEAADKDGYDGTMYHRACAASLAP